LEASDPACDDFNKREEWSCLPLNSTSTDHEHIFLPCSSTSTDSVVSYVLFQFFCLLLGVFSLILVRRESRKYLTEFDRRRKEGVQMTPLGKSRTGGTGTASKDKNNARDEEMISFLGGERGLV